MNPIITLQSVYKSYNSFNVLQDLNLAIYQGEMLSIIGRSGAGKSVLLRLLMGLETIDQGAIAIAGQNCATAHDDYNEDSSALIGMLFQSSALFDSLNIADNVAFSLTCTSGKKRFGALRQQEIESLVKQALQLVGLSDSYKSMPSDLSGGMKRRAALARLLVYKPKILLYDEPTTGLDPVTSLQIIELIAKIHQELNATSIIVTHDLNCALYRSDRLALHERGQIAYIDKTFDFIKSEHPSVKKFLNPTLQMLKTLTAPHDTRGFISSNPCPAGNTHKALHE